MNFFSEKEKKLNEALTKLKNLKPNDLNINKNIENLKDQKNQLEIEKKELEKKYISLVNEHDELSRKLVEFERQEKIEKQKQLNLLMILCLEKNYLQKKCLIWLHKWQIKLV